MKVCADTKPDRGNELFIDYIDPSLCVHEDGFFLHPFHLRRLREIKRLRREIDPSMSIPAMGTFDDNPATSTN